MSILQVVQHPLAAVWTVFLEYKNIQHYNAVYTTLYTCVSVESQRRSDTYRMTVAELEWWAYTI